MRGPDARRLVVPVIGAGVSVRSGMPLFVQLAHRLVDAVADADAAAAAAVRTTIRTTPIYDLIPALKHRLSERVFRDVVRQALTPEPDADLTLPRLVVGWRPRLVLTTNLDPLLEMACDAEGAPWSLIPLAQAAAAPEDSDTVHIVKLHGDVAKTRSWVLERDQIRQLWVEDDGFRDGIDGATAGRVLAVAGYGLGDDDIVAALARMAGRDADGAAYVFVSHAELAGLRERLSQIQAAPIPYDPADGHAELASLLERVFRGEATPGGVLVGPARRIAQVLEADGAAAVAPEGDAELLAAVLLEAARLSPALGTELRLRVWGLEAIAARGERSSRLVLGDGGGRLAAPLVLAWPAGASDVVDLAEQLLAALPEDLPTLRAAAATRGALAAFAMRPGDRARARRLVDAPISAVGAVPTAPLVVALCGLADSLRLDHTELDLAERCVDAAGLAARRLGDGALQARVVLAWAQILLRRGRFVDVLRRIDTVTGHLERPASELDAESLRIAVDLDVVRSTTLRRVGRLSDAEAAAERACAHCDEMIRRAPDDPLPALRRTNVELETGMIERARRQLRLAAAIFERVAERLHGLREGGGAGVEAVKAAWLEHKASGLLLELGVELGDVGLVRSCVRQLEGAVRPELPEVVRLGYHAMWRGRALELEGRLDEAARHYQAALPAMGDDDLGAIAAELSLVALDARRGSRAPLDAVWDRLELAAPRALGAWLRPELIEAATGVSAAVVAAGQTVLGERALARIEGWLDAERRDGLPVPRDAEARVLVQRGSLALQAGDLARAEELVQAALAAANDEGQSSVLPYADALRLEARVARSAGDLDRVWDAYGRLLGVARRLASPMIQAQALLALAEVLRTARDDAHGAWVHALAARGVLAEVFRPSADRTERPRLWQELSALAWDIELLVISILRKLAELDTVAARAMAVWSYGRTVEPADRGARVHAVDALWDAALDQPSDLQRGKATMLMVEAEVDERMADPEGEILEPEAHRWSRRLVPGVQACAVGGALEHAAQGLRILAHVWIDRWGATDDPTARAAAVAAMDEYCDEASSRGIRERLEASLEPAFVLALTDAVRAAVRGSQVDAEGALDRASAAKARLGGSPLLDEMMANVREFVFESLRAVHGDDVVDH